MSINNIPIYKAEAEIAQKIIANNSLAFLSPICQNISQKLNDFTISSFNKDGVGFARLSDFDLRPIHTVYVTTGCNGNDDIFDRYETWSAKDTPVHKPFNLEHDPRRVIGHIVSSHGMDVDWNEIDPGIAVDDLPDKFHLLTSAVIYIPSIQRDKELYEQISKIVEEIQENKWFVSMEVLFSNFDYGFIDGSNIRIESRNETTAHLTKHLRIYGGGGVYNNQKIGRVLRNMTFIGKGLVRKPANPESVIVSVDFPVLASEANSHGDDLMSDEIKVLQDENEKLTVSVADLKKQLQSIDEAKMETQIESLTANVASRDGTIVDMQKKIDELGAVATLVDSLKKEKEEVEAKYSEAAKKLADIEAAAKLQARVSTLVEKGVEKSVAESTAKMFEGLSDEQFSGIVELACVKKEASVESDPVGEAAVGETNLETIVKTDDLKMASANEDSGDELRAALGKFLGEQIAETRGRKSKEE